MNESAIVVINTPIYRAGSFVLDRFLANQKEIQRRSPYTELVLATIEPDFAEELKVLLGSIGIRGRVLLYETARPDYSRSNVWNVACGREAVREYMISKTQAEYMLCLDADMTCDPDIVGIMVREIQGYDVVYSGYPLRNFGIALSGGGCCMLTADVAREFKFRGRGFRNGTVITEDTVFEYDLIRSGRKIKKGFFLTVSHYASETTARSIGPRPLGPYRRIVHSPVFRYVLIKSSIVFQRDIGWWLLAHSHRLPGIIKSIPPFSKRA